MAAEAAIATRTAAEWDSIFAQDGVVAGGVHDLGEMLATGQAAARQLLAPVETAAGPSQVTTTGSLISGEALPPTSGVPLLGEHFREALIEHG